MAIVVQIIRLLLTIYDVIYKGLYYLSLCLITVTYIILFSSIVSILYFISFPNRGYLNT